MFMNLVSKPIVVNTIFTVFLGATLSIALSFFLPNKNFFQKSVANNEVQSNFEVAKAFNLEQKVQKIVKTSTVKQTSKEFLLKEFTITGIFLDDKDSMVIVKNSKGGVFVHINSSYKGYTLKEVYLKKAKFQKGINFYWSFLDPKAEKEFLANPHAIQNEQSAKKTSIKDTVAGAMFEDIKFKNGEYFIPKDMILNPATMNKHLSSIGAQVYNINGVVSFKITYIAPSSAFHKIGIKKGDFIVGAEGKKFHSVNEPLKYLQKIKNLKQVSIMIKRGNQNKELKYEVY